jgi:hypothetical protein
MLMIERAKLGAIQRGRYHAVGNVSNFRFESVFTRGTGVLKFYRRNVFQ